VPKIIQINGGVLKDVSKTMWPTFLAHPLYQHNLIVEDTAMALKFELIFFLFHVADEIK